MSMTRKIAVTIGDPNGIGPEIAVKAAVQLSGSAIEPVLVGDEFVIRTYLERHAGCSIDRVRLAPVDALDRSAFSPGTLDSRAGAATVRYVRRAFELVQRGEAEAIVGCPHSETAINRAGIAFSGYPNLVAALTGTPGDRVFLMLVAAGVRIAHVSLHESLRTALGRITAELVVAAGRATAEALGRLGVPEPRIGVRDQPACGRGRALRRRGRARDKASGDPAPRPRRAGRRPGRCGPPSQPAATRCVPRQV
jgi:4-hydroxythreonine-4-phosphate dehydrogenase